MVEVRPLPARFFDRGIDAIVDSPGSAGAPEALLPPGAGALAPAAQAHVSALDGLLAAVNLDALLDAAIRPGLADADLLMPARFQAVVEAVQSRLHDLADARRHADPPLGRLLAEAAAVLDEEAGLRDLLRTSLRSLLQG
jgi:type III secretion protein X